MHRSLSFNRILSSRGRGAARKVSIVEGENQRTLETLAADAPTAQGAVEDATAASMQSVPGRLLRRRLKRFVALAPRVRADADAKTIHDVRVCSRRLQQTLDALFPKLRAAKARRLRRMPRRIRRALGEWRNCDVVLELVARQQRRTRSDDKRQAWIIIRDHLLRKRAKAVARAVKRLLRTDLGDYAARARKVLRQPSDESPDLLIKRLGDSVHGAQIAWQASLTRAQETRAPGDLHGLRIATKVLRYRTELLYDLGAKNLKPQLKWLAALQDALGVWHDRQVLHQAVAEALAREEVLLNEMQAARILLAQLQKDRVYQAEAVEKIFHLAMERSPDQWMTSGSGLDATSVSTLDAEALATSVTDQQIETTE